MSRGIGVGMKANAPSGKVKGFYEDDGGFSTVGMVLAMLITLSLIFASAQVSRVQSASANIQNVADAAALAAENQVASFYIVANVCDAVVLSMSLTGICVAGLGVACMCVPFAAGLSVELEGMAGRIFQARNDFSKEASKGLNELQGMLPFLAAAQACSIAEENSGDEGRYLGCAVLLPFQGEKISIRQLDGANQTMAEMESQGGEIRESAKQAEQAAEDALVHKKAAFMADCGNDPSYCMLERASALAGLTGSANPVYRSVDSWSFSVALKRAQAYYPERLKSEAPNDGTVEEQARSAIRKNFFRYASKEVARGYVIDGSAEGGFKAHFPSLPANTEQMRGTSLYTQRSYPVTRDGDGDLLMHAWKGCPTACRQSAAGMGSVAMLEEGSYEECPSCGFSASSVGAVASASSNISNGFEHHYLIVAQEAEEYEKAMARFEPHRSAVEAKAGALLDSLKELGRQALAARISPMPPGRFGAVSVIACVDEVPVSSLFASGFVSDGGSLGPRAAISAATLAEDDPSETKNVIADLLSGFSADSAGAGAASIVLKLWSSLLMAYTEGHDALVSGVGGALDGLPLVSESGLGVWASEKLRLMIADFGLEPARLGAYKPVLVNSSRVMEAESGAFSQAMLTVKAAYAEVPASGSPLSAAFSGLGSLAEGWVVSAEEKMLIATVELLGVDATALPFSIALPPSAQNASISVVRSVFSRLEGLSDSVSPADEWR